MFKCILVLSAILAFSSQSFASCIQIDGIWNEPVDNTQINLENAGSFNESLWTISKNQLVTEYNNHDSFGIYFQYQLIYSTQLDPKTCVITARGTVAYSNSYRNFEDPMSDFSQDVSKISKLRYFQAVEASNQKMNLAECSDSTCSHFLRMIQLTQ